MPRKPRKLTPAERDEIDRVLEQCNGVMTTSAKVLGLTFPTLKNRIKGDDLLRRKWMGGDADPEADDRPLAISGEEKLAIAAAKDEKQLSKGFRELGFNDDEVALLSGLAQFTNGKMDGVIDLTYGSMVHNSAKLEGLFVSTFQKLQEVSENPEKYTEYNQTEKGTTIAYSGWKKMKELSNGLLEIAKEIRATNSAAEQTLITRAKIEEIKKRQMEDMKGPPKKPGFGGPPEVFGRGPTHLTQINNYGTKDAEVIDESSD